MRIWFTLCVALMGARTTSGMPFDLSSPHIFSSPNSGNTWDFDILPDFSLSSAIKEEKHFGFIPSLSYKNVDLDPEDTIRTTSLDVDLFDHSVLSYKQMTTGDDEASANTMNLNIWDDEWILERNHKDEDTESEHSLSGTFTDFGSKPTYRYNRQHTDGEETTEIELGTNFEDSPYWSLGQTIEGEKSLTAYSLQGDLENLPSYEFKHTIGNLYDRKTDYTFGVSGDLENRPIWKAGATIPKDDGVISVELSSDLNDKHYLSLDNDWSKGDLTSSLVAGTNLNGNGNFDFTLDKTNPEDNTRTEFVLRGNKYGNEVGLEASLTRDWSLENGNANLGLSTDFDSEIELSASRSWQIGKDARVGIAGTANTDEDWSVSLNAEKGALETQITYENDDGWTLYIPFYEKKF